MHVSSTATCMNFNHSHPLSDGQYPSSPAHPPEVTCSLSFGPPYNLQTVAHSMQWTLRHRCSGGGGVMDGGRVCGRGKFRERGKKQEETRLVAGPRPWAGLEQTLRRQTDRQCSHRHHPGAFSAHLIDLALPCHSVSEGPIQCEKGVYKSVKIQWLTWWLHKQSKESSEWCKLTLAWMQHAWLRPSDHRNKNQSFYRFIEESMLGTRITSQLWALVEY